MEVSDNRYPHQCPFCAHSAYINGMDQIECNNQECQKWDGKNKFGDFSQLAVVWPESIAWKGDLNQSFFARGGVDGVQPMDRPGEPIFLPINFHGNHEERVLRHLEKGLFHPEPFKFVDGKPGPAYKPLWEITYDLPQEDIVADSVSNDRYPHRCDSCGSKAYIGGNNNVECSNSACKHWDKKDDFDFDWFYKNSPQSDTKDPVGNPNYQAPNPGADIADDSAWSPADCPCAPPFCDKCKKVFGTTP